MEQLDRLGNVGIPTSSSRPGANQTQVRARRYEEVRTQVRLVRARSAARNSAAAATKYM